MHFFACKYCSTLVPPFKNIVDSLQTPWRISPKYGSGSVNFMYANSSALNWTSTLNRLARTADTCETIDASSVCLYCWSLSMKYVFSTQCHVTFRTYLRGWYLFLMISNVFLVGAWGKWLYIGFHEEVCWMNFCILYQLDELIWVLHSILPYVSMWLELFFRYLVDYCRSERIEQRLVSWV